jgi:hypothetical protein
MGYTHYWKFKGEKTMNEGVLSDIQKVVSQYHDILQYEHDVHKSPVVSKKAIRFNGIDERGHETFLVIPGSEFDCCKTARKPYDMPVCQILLILKHHYGKGFELSSDGLWVSKEEFKAKILDENWNEALDIVKKEYGYHFELIPNISHSQGRSYYSFGIQAESEKHVEAL